MRVIATERFAVMGVDHRAIWGQNPQHYPPGSVMWPFDAEARGYDMAMFRPWVHGGNPRLA